MSACLAGSMSKSDFPASVRRTIAERDLNRCAFCGSPLDVGANAHHRKLRSRGGMGDVANGILLCGSGTTGCHGWVHREVEASTAMGYIVSRWGNPAEVPVWTWRGWVLLDDEGGMLVWTERGWTTPDDVGVGAPLESPPSEPPPRA